jgi:predicted dehydrogenase
MAGVCTLVMSFTVSAWGAYSGYLGRREAGGGVTLDVASHQLDLLAWLGGTHVTRVEPLSYHRHSDASEEIQYRCVLATGATAECLARHGVVYLEAMSARSERGTILSHATGFVRSTDEKADGLWRSAERRAWIDRKWMRLGLMQDPLTITSVISGGVRVVAGGATAPRWRNDRRRRSPRQLAHSTIRADIRLSLRGAPRSLKARPAGDEAEVTDLCGGERRDGRRQSAPAGGGRTGQRPAAGIEEAEVLLIDVGTRPPASPGATILR